MDNNRIENRDGAVTNPVSDNSAYKMPYSQGPYPQVPEWTKNIVISDKPWIPPGEEGNVSVRFNESEKAEPDGLDYEAASDEETADKKEWPMWMQIGVLLMITLVAVALLVANIKARTTSPEEVTTVPAAVTTVQSATSVPATVPSVSGAITNNYTTENTGSDKEDKTTEKDDEPTFAPSVSNGQSEKEKKEIIEYFNECSNRVKAEAVKVVKNFENRSHNEDKLKLPSAIKGVAKSVLESKITDLTEPVEYPTAEAIIARYPVPGAEWSSKLTAEDVETATRTDKGDEYEITLFLKTCVDPSPETGTSRAMDCLDVPTVRDTAPPFITAFSAEYYDCVIRCRVEKATGRVVWSNYTAPVLLKLGLDAGFVEFDAEIGLTFEKDYTITY
ncbi:MAG: hypothetical protein IJN88_04360 [Clostridia bacterium]|nr:hypothetical protein [Clostridia bacterium]